MLSLVPLSGERADFDTVLIPRPIWEQCEIVSVVADEPDSRHRKYLHPLYVRTGDE